MIVNLIESVEYACFYTVLCRKNKLLAFLFCFVASSVFIEVINAFSVTAGYYSAVNYLIGFITLSIGELRNSLQKISCSLMPELITAAVNSFLTGAVSFLFYGAIDYASLFENQYVLMIILTKVFQILLLYLTARIILGNELEIPVFDEILIIASILLCKAAIDSLEFLLYLDHYDSFHLGIAILCVVGFIVVLGFTGKDVSDKTKEIMHADSEKQAMSYRMDLMKENIASQQELSRMRHDVQHLLNLVRTGSTAAVKVEAENLQNELNQKVFIPVETISAPVNQILNIERQKAMTKGIHVVYHLSIIREPLLSEDEIYMLLTNLLDNAIDHIGSGKEILVSISSDEEEFAISVRNSIDGKILDSSGQMPASKRPGHGYGMMTVRNVVNRHHGYLSMSDEEGYFTIRILLSGKVQI